MIEYEGVGMENRAILILGICVVFFIGFFSVLHPAAGESMEPHGVAGGLRPESPPAMEDGNLTGSPGCVKGDPDGLPPQKRNCWDPAARDTVSAKPTPIALEEFPAAVDCEIDLVGNRIGIRRPAAISMQMGPCNGRAVVKITLDPRTTEYRKASIEILYGGVSTGWTLNIGDSPSNNGYSGDGGDQSHDGEAQILDGNLAVFGDDHMAADTTTGKILAEAKGLVGPLGEERPERIVTFEISNNRLGWKNDQGVQGQVSSPYIFSLKGQEDSEGPPNYDLFVGFNQVVSGGREGSGAQRIRIKLSY